MAGFREGILMGGLIGVGSRLLTRAGASIASSPARAGAAGAAGGVLLDDIPILSGLDPTEGEGSGQNLTVVLVLVLVLVVAFQMSGDL